MLLAPLTALPDAFPAFFPAAKLLLFSARALGWLIGDRRRPRPHHRGEGDAPAAGAAARRRAVHEGQPRRVLTSVFWSSLSMRVHGHIDISPTVLYLYC